MSTSVTNIRVHNVYHSPDRAGDTKHRKLHAAFKAAARREGDGWQVYATVNGREYALIEGPDGRYYDAVGLEVVI